MTMLLALDKPVVPGISVSLPVVMDFQGYLSKGVMAHLSLDGLSIVTDNPYLLRYQKNGPPVQPPALAVSQSNGDIQRDHPSTSVRTTPPRLSWRFILQTTSLLAQLVRDLLVLVLPKAVARRLAPSIAF